MKTDCPAIIQLTTNRATQKLFIKKIIADHSHHVSKEAFENYPQNRAVRKADQQTKHELQILLNAKANPRKILEHLEFKTGSSDTVKSLAYYKRILQLQGNF